MAKQASAPDGSWYDVRIRPYRTARNAVEGLVVTFVDITETKRAERIQAARVLAESIVDAVREPLLVLDGTLRVVRGNRSFHRLFRVEPARDRRAAPRRSRQTGSGTPRGCESCSRRR